MRGAPWFLATFLTAFVLAAVGTAEAYHTRFVTEHCHFDDPTPMSSFTRDGATTIVLRARHEGYQWGGGCWNNNDVDDSPGDPTQDPATGGEGPDCSGLTFKTWRESLNTSNANAYGWGRLRYVHGPYTSVAFKRGDGAPNVTASKSALIRMDALASEGHIGLVYAPNPDGSDQIAEAKGEAYGTNIWTRTYRGSTSYSGVRRTGWSS
jgi:hypothetical protein